MKTGRSLQELYGFPGFRAAKRLKGRWGDPQIRVIRLIRREKKRFAVDVISRRANTTILGLDRFAIWTVRINESTWNGQHAEWPVRFATN